ncbi:MAG: hypothetical protein A2806_00980 [Candidatus Terrybacteria bacterium RIFCSPHIGHO2_01_FULL_48_17]|uniref:Uncharacterized protein n=1 Tax=Candidatus Terrybacteria bacterium RIFCSPHIGHO2_01_FULL_48_17 TaxID=1802362 RepID=A0A1G2PK82_9BACT|nr:MAG: hypothetical protein A2806_00980 [Candidatus Terrybacteria bacterium RIFCSPHIGHO2_01_FULL_48_17]OHA51890.1 MAG: hypothetical protein A3A30_00995 [Candidatus Terrybacteria bacterium RIFCSPLOWO2_01_FULL_48_14]
MKAGQLEVGFVVNFTQTGRIAHVWDDKSQKRKREPLPDRRVDGVVTSIVAGANAVQITVHTPEERSITAHLPTEFNVGKVRQGRGSLTRWRCANRKSGCAAGEWTPESDVPIACPECGAEIDIEKEGSA